MPGDGPFGPVAGGFVQLLREEVYTEDSIDDRRTDALTHSSRLNTILKYLKCISWLVLIIIVHE